MLLVERHKIKETPEIVRLCQTSKELYNKCNYYMRKQWFVNLKTNNWTTSLPDISKLKQLVRQEPSFNNLHNTKTAMQTVRKCLIDWQNFRKAIKAYNKNPSKFEKKPRPPKYKDKLAQVVFFNETIRKHPLKEGIITPTNDCFSIKSDIKDFKQIIIVPKRFGFVIDVQYEKEEQKRVKGKGIVCIDIGLNNLAAITSNQFLPILVNGRILKSVNQYYNKHKNKKNLAKRYWRVENYFHHASKFIISLCIKYSCNTIIIGKNDYWKQKINLGKRANQNFCYIPYCNLFQKIMYKAELVGIKVIFTEESYTSKASFLDRDPLPKFDKNSIEEYRFSGKRVTRGFYQSSTRPIHADIQGSLNIGRKVIGDKVYETFLDRSIVAMPARINPLKVSM